MPRLFYDLSCLSVVASNGFQALSYGFQALFHEAITFAGYRPSQGAGFHWALALIGRRLHQAPAVG